MAPADRQTTTHIANRLLAEAHQHHFFLLLERLHGLHGDDLEQEWDSEAAAPRLRLGSDPRLTFPVADVLEATRIPERTDNKGRSRYQVCTTFFGLHGTDSPLPSHYLDELAYEHAQGNGVRPAFFDFFNHCLLSLLHRSWRKYRYYIRFQAQANDRFSRYIFALIGLGNDQLRGNTLLPWGRLLSFAGVIANRSRAPGTVAGIIAHCFDLQSVRIREFETRSVATHARQTLSLGRSNGHLGSTFVLGGRTRTRSSKFTLLIDDLDQAQLRAFLPSGINFARLRALIDFLLRDGLAYDLELRLKQHQLTPFNLGRTEGAHLGWTSFIDDRQGKYTPVVRIRGRS